MLINPFANFEYISVSTIDLLGPGQYLRKHLSDFEVSPTFFGAGSDIQGQIPKIQVWAITVDWSDLLFSSNTWVC